jgi:hypothetical protein
VLLLLLLLLLFQVVSQSTNLVFSLNAFVFNVPSSDGVSMRFASSCN